MSMLPSEYFKQNIYATTWFEHRNLAALDRIGRRGQHHVRDRLPAPDVPVPRPVEDRRAQPRRTCSPEVQRKILGENAAKLYKL